ncbi:MAG: hypothetical protein ABIR03_00915 [Ginsengibacter sp.]
MQVSFSGSTENDLYVVLKNEGLNVKRYATPEAAIKNALNGTGVFIIADDYPEKKNNIKPEVLQMAQKKKLRLYIEYPLSLPGLSIIDTIVKTSIERGVITSNVFGEHLKPMSLLGINDCHVLPVEVNNPLIVLGKVVGFNKAEYGINDIKTYPLLFQKDNMLVATTKLSDFATGRYAPEESWEKTWDYIVSWVIGVNDFHFNHWLSFVSPMYLKDATLAPDARKNSILKGVEWFYNGRFFIDSSWKDMWLKYQGDGLLPLGPSVSQRLPNGDGSLGILEGHASNIYFNGTQQYRYWVRADVQGEVAYALAAAGSFLHKEAYHKVAKNLTDFIFYNSNLRSGNKNDKDSSVYGLIGWSVTHPGVFYGDDNARCLLGIIGASAYMNTDEWDEDIIAGILANFRTTGKNGFRGARLEEKDILKEGWKYFQNRDIVNTHPHFESWMWACYLWLYDKTGYKPLLKKTETAIRMTMKDYPAKWKWTNGIQQERARMILPLAWLVRVDDTPEHRQWLDNVVTKLLDNQVESGAIREELGAGKGQFGRTASNKEYGLHEAPLIYENGDPVADMLYTSNFAFFSLNEAAQVTGNKKYKEAVIKLSDFLTRIQIKSDKHKDLDGGWFRAFDYKRWDYWASNADAGWGAWSTLTGWIQSWIVTTQVLVERNQSYWELTKKSTINKQMPQAVKTMFENDSK